MISILIISALICIFIALYNEFKTNKKTFLNSINNVVLFIIIFIFSYSNLLYFSYDDTKMIIKEEKINIYSINSSNNTNYFYINNLILKEEDKYSVFRLNEDNSKTKILINSLETTIYEEENINKFNSYLMKFTCTPSETYSLLLGIFIKDYDECKFETLYKLYVPKGTVIDTIKIN